jgi:hypothetical protein
LRQSGGERPERLERESERSDLGSGGGGARAGGVKQVAEKVAALDIVGKLSDVPSAEQAGLWRPDRAAGDKALAKAGDWGGG